MDYERIVLDIETQRDFFLPSGSLYSDAAAEASRNIYRIFEWVRANNIPVISTVLRVRPFATGPMSDRPHCVDGTDGEKKLPRTVLPRRINLGMINSTDLPDDLFQRCQQVIFEKRNTDIFAHARAERLLTELHGSTFILCGAGVAQGLVQAAVGLRTRGFGVIVARDAIVDFGHPRAEMACLRMQAKGAIFAPTADIIATPIPPKRRAFRTTRTSEKKAT